MTRPSAYQAPQHALKVGERVRLLAVPDDLLRSLPDKDADAVRAVVGKLFAVAGFNALGEVELEFRARDGILHTIWVPPACVRKPGAKKHAS